MKFPVILLSLLPIALLALPAPEKDVEEIKKEAKKALENREEASKRFKARSFQKVEVGDYEAKFESKSKRKELEEVFEYEFRIE
jgi:hypothetical protein